jgi:hypothetical protein
MAALPEYISHRQSISHMASRFTLHRCFNISIQYVISMDDNSTVYDFLPHLCAS